MLQATTGEQIQEFLDSNGGVAVVDCYATWCGPCIAIAPYLKQKHQETGIPFVKVDVDQAPEVSQAYNISCMPTMMVVQGNYDNVLLRKEGGSKAYVDELYNLAAQKRSE